MADHKAYGHERRMRWRRRPPVFVGLASILAVAVVQAEGPQIGNPMQVGKSLPRYEAETGISAAAGYFVDQCDCSDCKNEIRRVSNTREVTSNHFIRDLAAVCAADGKCRVAMYNAAVRVGFLYDHAQETVKRSAKDVSLWCFVKASACHKGVHCDHLKGLPSRPVLAPPTTAAPIATHHHRPEPVYPNDCKNCGTQLYFDYPKLQAALARVRALPHPHLVINLLGSAQNIFYDNWMQHVMKVPGLGPVITACMDARAFEFCQKFRNLASRAKMMHFCIPPNKKSPFPKQGKKMVQYLDNTYNKCIQQKPGLLYEGLRHGIDTLMTDIDTVYLKNPFEYFYEKHLGEKRLFMQGPWCGNLNTGIVFAVASPATVSQAHSWGEHAGPGPAGQYHGHNDQDVINNICRKLPEFKMMSPKPFRDVLPGSAANYDTSKDYIRWACSGCHDSRTVVSHCTHGSSKIAAMKKCPGWWTPKFSTAKDNNYCADYNSCVFANCKCHEAHTV